MRFFNCIFVVGFALLWNALNCQASGERMRWSGDGLLAWTRSSAHCENLRIDGGVLKGTVVGRDPQLHLTLPVPLVPQGNHVVSVRMRSHKGGRCQMFWREEGDGSYSESRQRDFILTADGQWHDYRVFMDWCGGKSIVGLRFDLPSEMFNRDAFEIGEIAIQEVGQRLNVSADGKAGVAFALQMPVGVHYCTIEWCSQEWGRGVYYFTPATDGKRHDYWFDLRKAKDFSGGPNNGKPTWRGTVVRCGVFQSRQSKALPVENFRIVSGKPDMPADLTIVSAHSASAIPRAGRPFVVETVVRNLGTLPAKNIRFAFDGLPAGVSAVDVAELSPADVVSGNEGHQYFPSEFRYHCAPFAFERVFRLRLTDPGVGRHEFGLTVKADGSPASRAVVRANVLPSLGLKRASYPEEPQPVDTTPYEIGAFLFPGWKVHAWYPVWCNAPWRKPVLGWYDETKPETIDWQIKQMAENGISFVSVDWYWSSGDHKTPNAWPLTFAKAKYRKYLKWSVMWANHNAPGSHSADDQAEVTRYWIDNYFNDPQYQRIDGKPVVAIWSPDSMERDMKGKGGCRALIEISRQLAKKAGYGGIHFIAIRGPDSEDPRFLAKFADMGFDRTFVYRYLGEGVAGVPTNPDGSRPFKWIAETSLDHWRALKRNSKLPFLPSLSTGWDNRPWLGERGWNVSGTTNEEFLRICRDAKTYSDETGDRMLMMGPLDEWGEGEIGYPNAERGYGMFEALRETFGRKSPKQRMLGWPVNHAPEDVGLECPQLLDCSLK